MADVKTDWFPMSTPPVHHGEYEVKAKVDLISEEELSACWDRRLGQLGFWKKQVWTDHMKMELLTVTEWRGRELPRRMQLLEELPMRPRVKVILE